MDNYTSSEDDDQQYINKNLKKGEKTTNQRQDEDIQQNKRFVKVENNEKTYIFDQKGNEQMNEQQIDDFYNIDQGEDAMNNQNDDQYTSDNLKGKLLFGQNSKKVTIKFSMLVKFFEEISKKRGKEKKIYCQRFFDEVLFKNDREPYYSHSILRLMFPNIDRLRGNYGIKEQNLAKLITKALVLNERSSERLKKWKNAQHQPYGAPSGDFVEVMYDTIKQYFKDESELTIGELNEYLDQLASTIDNPEQEQTIRQIILFSTALEFKWIGKIILKDLKIGLTHDHSLVYFHPDALDYYNRTSSLADVCKELQDKDIRLKNVMKLFQAIKPMLAKREKISSLSNILLNKNFFIETKYDGERIQCHFDKNMMKFFSRNSIDYTYLYAQKLEQVIRNNVQDCEAVILDGEIIVIEKETGQAQPFGLNKNVAQNQDPYDIYQICYKVFDILYVKAKRGDLDLNLMEIPLQQRKNILQKVIPQGVKNVFEIVQSIESSNISDISKEFNDSMDRNEEGIIIKQADSQYTAHQRSNKWIKMKGDYIQGLNDNLDLLIIGGYFGKHSYRVGGAHWTDNITTFLIGIAQNIDTNNPSNSIIIPFCKVGTGYSKEELQNLRNQLRDKWVQGETRPRYIYQNWKPSFDDRPDAYIKSPDDSIILEVKAAEITQSNTWPTDYTLRFPRVEKIRYNKDWNECMTLSELKDFIQGDLKRTRDDSDDEENEKNNNDENKKKKKVGGGIGGRKILKKDEKQNLVLDQFKDTDVSGYEVLSNLFNGFVFHIINLKVESENQKDFLEINIHQYGGIKVQNDSQYVTHYIAEVYDFKVDAIARKYNTCVFQPKYILDCIKKEKVLSHAPRFFLSMSPDLALLITRNYDKYGDSFKEDVDQDTVLELFKCMNIDDETIRKLKHDQKLIQLRKQIFSEYFQKKNQILDNSNMDSNSFNHQNEILIDETVFCFAREKSKVQEDCQLLHLVTKIRYLGGTVLYGLPDADNDDQQINILILLDYNEKEIKKIKEFQRLYKPQLLNIQQIQEQYSIKL